MPPATLFKYNCCNTTYQCIEDPNGQYTGENALQDCNENCKPPTPTPVTLLKYKCDTDTFVCKLDASGKQTIEDCQKSCKKPGCYIDPKTKRCQKGLICNPIIKPSEKCHDGTLCNSNPKYGPCPVHCSSGDICPYGPASSAQCPSNGLCPKYIEKLPTESNCPPMSSGDNIDVQWEKCYASSSAMLNPGCHFVDQSWANKCNSVKASDLKCEYVSDDSKTNWNSGDGKDVNEKTKQKICEDYGKIHAKYTDKWDICVYDTKTKKCTSKKL